MLYEYTEFPQSEPALKYKPPSIISLANIHSKINKTCPQIQFAVLTKSTATSIRCFYKKPPREYFVASYLVILITHSLIFCYEF